MKNIKSSIRKHFTFVIIITPITLSGCGGGGSNASSIPTEVKPTSNSTAAEKGSKTNSAPISINKNTLAQELNKPISNYTFRGLAIKGADFASDSFSAEFKKAAVAGFYEVKPSFTQLGSFLGDLSTLSSGSETLSNGSQVMRLLSNVKGKSSEYGMIALLSSTNTSGYSRDKFGFYHGGMNTQKMPITGSASYSGRHHVGISGISNNTLYSQGENIQATANFGTGEVTFQPVNFSLDNGTAGQLTYRSSSINGSSLNGESYLVIPGSNIEGNYSAGFYGSNADEIVGTSAGHIGGSKAYISTMILSK